MDSTTRPVIITCHKCGEPIGEIMGIGGVELLKIGNLIVRAAHGACINCQQAFHYTMSDTLLSRIMTRAMRMEIRETPLELLTDKKG